MKKITKEEFIKRANEIHNFKYDYSKVEYINNHTKVEIICGNHSFLQIPKDHLNGRGCNKCYYLTRCDTYGNWENQFIEKANVIHNFKYDYSKVDYKNNYSEVIIICPTHGEFLQQPKNHILRKHICPNCKEYKPRISTTEQFIKKAKEIHGDKYDYSLVEYITTNRKVIIICKKHGQFNQFAGDHLSGKGCQQCGKLKSWNLKEWENAGKESKKFDSFKFYIIKCWNDKEEFYKFGRTFQEIKTRYWGKFKLPYEYEIENVVIGNAEYIFNLESEFRKKYKHLQYIPKIKFGGRFECFKIT